MIKMLALSGLILSLAIPAGRTGAQDVIKIGMITPLTGGFALDGSTNVNGARLAAKEINDKGGVLGRRLEIIVEDGACRPAEAVNAAQKLVFRDKVPVIMGGFCSSATLAVMPIAEKNKIPLVTGVSSNPKLTEMGNEWFFRNAETEALMARAFAMILYRDMNLKKAFFLAQNDEWGRSSVAAYKAAFEQLGGRTVGVEYVDQSATDFYTPLTKIRASGVDVAIVAAPTQSGSIIARQAKELGLKSRIYGVGAWVTPTFMELAADAANGILAGATYAPTLTAKRNTAFVAMYRSAYGELPGRYSASGYNTIHIIAQAIQRAGAADSQKIRDALTKTDYEGPNGRIRFDAKHQAYGLNMVLVELQNKAQVIKAVSSIEKP